jgi:hydroxyacylglutathione hydrolase
MKKRGQIGCLWLCALLAVVSSRAGGQPAEADAATRGVEAANLQLVTQTEERTSDFVFRQYSLAVLSHYSYLIGSGGEALIVDPDRDIGRYLKDAQELGLRITKVYLTHTHADFVAGHIELALATGANIVVNEAAMASFPHMPALDGDTITFGKVRGVVVTTPGHTPDATCLYVYMPAAESNPRFVLTGDTLLVGGVGRPEMASDRVNAAALAAMGYDSWTEKLVRLRDETRFFPAHGTGAPCCAQVSDQPVSTIGEQRKSNVYLQCKDAMAYIMAVTEGLPDAPQYFRYDARMNREGPRLIDWSKTAPRALAPAEAADLALKGAWLVDVRDAAPFAAGHPAGAVNIGIRGRFETWAGTMIPWGDPLVLIGAEREVQEAAYRLKRIGYDTPIGYLQGGFDRWDSAGLPVQTVAFMKPAELYKQMQDGVTPSIVDVRQPSDWRELRIGEVLNIPLDRLADGASRMAKDIPVVTVGDSAYRSSIAASFLIRMGFKDVRNLEGGMEAWLAAGLPTISDSANARPAARTTVVTMRLPVREFFAR